MRRILIALGLAAFAASGVSLAADAAKEPAKSKMGCVVGKEKWDAKVGKCAPAAPVKKAAPAKKAEPAKAAAPAKKAAPAKAAAPAKKADPAKAAAPAKKDDPKAAAPKKP